MADMTAPSPSALRQARADDPSARDRDLAERLGAREAQLVAAHAARGATRIDAHPDRLIAAVQRLGEVMALTRNDSCVHERVGRYGDYRSGEHAASVLGEEIDLRIFPSHWVHAFAVERATPAGPRRSLQVFDAAGDAIHKVHLREGSDHAAWEGIVAALRLDDQSDSLAVAPRLPVEPAKADPAGREALRAAWARMTDTHQFLGLAKKHRMNRLGAYRSVGEPWARPLAPRAVDAALSAARDRGTGIMIFVGNRGCIQIHSGPIANLRPMGPWQNVMDPRFNLHLRADHVAEAWAVEKPTRRGPALSVEGFDRDGGLILQIFPVPKEGKDSRPEWAEIVAALPARPVAEVA